MVISRNRLARRRGAFTADLIAAMAIFVIAFVPVAVTVVKEHRLARILYNRAVAGQILDGELEILLAGEWRALQPGTHPLTVLAEAKSSLPPGHFEVTLDGRRLQLEWRADKRQLGGHTKRLGWIHSP